MSVSANCATIFVSSSAMASHGIDSRARTGSASRTAKDPANAIFMLYSLSLTGVSSHCDRAALMQMDAWHYKQCLREHEARVEPRKQALGITGRPAPRNSGEQIPYVDRNGHKADRAR
jgi:hypothetical protein